MTNSIQVIPQPPVVITVTPVPQVVNPQESITVISGQIGPTGPTGPAGADGADGANGLNGEGFNFRGEWVTDTLYLENDVVTQNGSTYIANYDYQDTDGPSLDGDLWATLALKGADGADGADGSDGADGADALWDYLGEYNGSIIYGAGAVVTYDGQLWYRNVYTSAGYVPGVGNSYWDLLAAKGVDGADGTNGTNGTNGADFGIYYLGNYNPLSGYVTDIAVVRGSDGQLYLAKASGSLGNPIDYLSNGQWEIWIPKGADGTNGTNGTNGTDAIYDTDQAVISMQVFG